MEFRISIFDAARYNSAWFIDVLSVDFSKFSGSLLYVGRDDVGDTNEWAFDLLYTNQLVDWVKSKF